MPTCLHYALRKQVVTGLGHPLDAVRVAQCTLLEQVPLRLRVQMCDRMAQEGGSTAVSTECSFNGEPDCPYYHP
jgi:hypothetical protein